MLRRPSIAVIDMDTPNTRSRRKREVNDEEAQDEGGTVEWQHDQRLRRMMVEAAVGGE